MLCGGGDGGGGEVDGGDFGKKVERRGGREVVGVGNIRKWFVLFERGVELPSLFVLFLFMQRRWLFLKIN